MSKITITEGLAELKTIDSRIEKKQGFVRDFLFRQNAQRDPHEKDGGSSKLIEQERQAIRDLELRKVTIRRAIADANAATKLTVGKQTMSVADWIVWRREVVPGREVFLNSLHSQLNQVRTTAMNKGLAVSSPEAAGYLDIVVNVNEKELAVESEELTDTLGVLDGQLSLKNATVMIDV